MAEQSDDELVRRFVADGDRAAFAELVERHQRRVFNIAYRMLGQREDAADAVQDVFLRCLRKLGAFRGQAAFTTWLHRVTVNVCYDRLRRRREHLSLDEHMPDSPVSDRTDEMDAAADVHRALQQVRQEFRIVVVLHDLQGQPYEAIAEALGAPIGTVKSRLHRGRVALARILRGERSGAAVPSNEEP